MSHKETPDMKLASLALAAGLLAVPAIALGQSAPAPKNTSGPGVSPSVQSPTDPGQGNASGNTKATPSKKMTKRTKKHSTMGSAAKSSMKMKRPAENPNASPASPAEGAKKEKYSSFVSSA
jgi:hypothetical protein